ncbi:MAG: hypothetical protein E7649_00500 [Ruminococcaceae bacterium]|nr:hypothetical protein [Oscillospiraceae bacterium]
MKPSERRALQQQKRAQTENYSEVSVFEPGDNPKVEDHEPSKEKKEGFFKRHARLIAFLITSFVIITVFSPFAVDMFLEAQKNKNKVTDKQDLVMNQVYAIADNYGDITWKTFENFNYEDRSRDDGKYYTRVYPIEGTLFFLKVGGEKLSGAPEYIYLMSYYDADYANLAKDNVRLFVEKYLEEE